MMERLSLSSTSSSIGCALYLSLCSFVRWLLLVADKHHHGKLSFLPSSVFFVDDADFWIFSGSSGRARRPLLSQIWYVGINRKI